MTETYWRHGLRLTSSCLVVALVALTGCGGGEPAADDMTEDAPAMEEAASEMPEAAVVDAGALGADPAAYEGQMIRLNGMMAASVVGTGAVFVELPTDPAPTAFLVRSDSPPAAGAMFDVVGTVTAITAAAVDEWVSAGEITENDRLVVEFNTHYLEAESVESHDGM